MIRRILITILMVIGFCGCNSIPEAIEPTEPVEPGPTEPIAPNKQISLNFKSFNNDETSQPTLTEIEMFIFNDGVLTDRSVNKLDEENLIHLDLYGVITPKVFFIADPDQQIDYSHLLVGGTSESDFLATHTMELNFINGDSIYPFYTGMQDLTDIAEPSISIDIEAGVAQFDIKIEPNMNLTVENIKVTNVYVKSYMHSQPSEGESDFKTMNFKKAFTPGLSNNTENIFYLFEQRPTNSHVELKLAGIDRPLQVSFPENIERNHIYDINVSMQDGKAYINITAQKWEDGEDTEVDPDFEFSKIDIERSELPVYVKVSKTLDTLFIPSCDTQFKLAISATSEIEVAADVENQGDFTVTPLFDPGAYINTTYQIAAKSRAVETIGYLKIKSKNHGYDYGDKIVVVLEASKLRYTGELSKYFRSGEIKFNKYIDGELGTIQVPATSTLTLGSETQWLRIEDDATTPGLKRVKAGFRPNNMVENGTVQEYSYTVSHTTGESESATISRISNSLPVVKVNNQYWCMYNLRGNSRNFKEQILEKQEDLYSYLQTCSDERFIELMGDGYKGIDTIGMKVVSYIAPPEGEDAESTIKFTFENFSESNEVGHTGSITTCPDGYTLPSKADYANILIALRNTGYGNEWTNSLGERQRLATFPRENLKIGGHDFASNVFVYSNENKNEGIKVVLYGLGYQENKNNAAFVKKTLLAYGSIGNFWRIDNDGQHILTTTSADQLDKSTVRYIRCIKEEKSGFFIY